MPLEKKIEKAEHTIANLSADHQKLSDLLAEKNAELEKLRSGGGRNFQKLAELQSQRDALQAMVSEQQHAVDQAHKHLRGLLEQQGPMRELQSLTDRIASTRQELRGGLQDLFDHAAPKLEHLAQLHVTWNELRAEWTQRVLAMGAPAQNGGTVEEAERFYENLRSEAINVDAALTGVTLQPHLLCQIVEKLPGQAEHEAVMTGAVAVWGRENFKDHLPPALYQLFLSVLAAHGAAKYATEKRIHEDNLRNIVLSAAAERQRGGQQ